VVIPAQPPKLVGKLGLIIATDDSRDRMGLAAQVGRIVAASPIAFNYDAWPAGTTPPGVGDIVWFARYSGGEVEGLDGRTYRVIKDKDITAVITRANAPKDSIAQQRAAALAAGDQQAA
jgi:co-chaperonin GroES (HSP10)